MKAQPKVVHLRSLVTNSQSGLYRRTGTLGAPTWLSGIRFVTLDPDPKDPKNPWQAMKILYHENQWEEIKEPHA